MQQPLHQNLDPPVALLSWQGGEILTPFRLEKLSELIRSHLPISQLEVRRVYFIVLDTLSYDPELKAQLEQLKLILTDVSAVEITESTECLTRWVVPRLGTLSSWSSKATDIVHNCGLSRIQRIEQGVQYRLLGLTTIQLESTQLQKVQALLHDAMTESVLDSVEQFSLLVKHQLPSAFASVPVLEKALPALAEANARLGLGLNQAELAYLLRVFTELKRDPSDAELMMFAQINSEHCRHKIFNAQWMVDGKAKPLSLFKMIRNTQALNSDNVWLAYSDNAAVLKGYEAQHFWMDPKTHRYRVMAENAPIVLKVETHNHPTAISPKAGAATGSGGEIRDEAATGRGSFTRAGLAGFSVSHLRIPDVQQPWEGDAQRPSHLASALQIMLEGPIGSAEYNNEFGRPCLLGYFRNFEYKTEKEYRAYHKPIMIAGGIGGIRLSQLKKQKLRAGVLLIVLGGPALPIGLGGGSASSQSSGGNQQDLDFASVQRANAEMERRAQEVINACWLLGDENPILSIHDVGAGGLANAMPELIHADDLGGDFDLRAIPTAAPGMSPLELWCNEAQERYVLAISKESLAFFTQMAERERCPFAVMGEAKETPALKVEDDYFNNEVIALPMKVLFDEWPPLTLNAEHQARSYEKFDTANIELKESVFRVLQFPCVADKSFLITIGDRSVTGLVARDQMVGPWQVPVSDVAVTCNDYFGFQGAAVAMGERSPLALLNPAASARMAVAEALTNMAAAFVGDLSHISLSANWMAAAEHPGEAAALYDAVEAVGMELCPALGISIPVGKDSLSMSARWKDRDKEYHSVAPLSLVITAAGRVQDVRKTLTPLLHTQRGETQLLLIDLGRGRHALGASVLAQSYQALGQEAPDLKDPQDLKNFFAAIQALNAADLILAYHDRSDGGLLATLCEMIFASHVGLRVDLSALGSDPLAALFSEELGAVIQVQRDVFAKVMSILNEHNLAECVHVIAELNASDELLIFHHEQLLLKESRIDLHRAWSKTSFKLQALRDNPSCAEQQYEALLRADDPGLNARVSFDLNHNRAAPYINVDAKPKVAILREQGVNGHIEMAAAFAKVGFESTDVHMSDIQQGRVQLKQFAGLVACGGFSYGDVLGAGRGWAQSILMHARARDQFAEFFERSDSFALGVCNGCQLFSQLKSIIPGAEHWPQFKRNLSEQFEARLSLVEVVESPSLFLRGMAGSILPITVAHGEGRAVFDRAEDQRSLLESQQICLRYVDSYHQIATDYPANPNGSPLGLTGLCNRDGRVSLLMPHPERVVRRVQLSWAPAEWGEDSPWLQFFANARVFVD